jgi:hypothetical protein
MTWEDWEHDVAWAVKFLQSRQIRSGDFVALVSTGHEAPWYGPILDAANLLRATICPLEPARFESLRAKMFFTRFPISSVIGLDLELCAAIDQAIGLKQALGTVRNILVRPNALKLVQEAGLRAEVMAPIGPALGLPCAGESMVVHVNEAEWKVTQVAEGIVVHTRARGGLPGGPMQIPIGAEWIADCRCSCVHGRSGLRLK